MVEQRSPKPRAEGSSPSAPARSLKPVENSYNCKYAVACEEFTGVFHTFSHEIHTKKRRYNVMKEVSSREGAVVLVSNKNIVSMMTTWSSGSNPA